jgi:hypothetical protein
MAILFEGFANARQRFVDDCNKTSITPQPEFSQRLIIAIDTVTIANALT